MSDLEGNSSTDYSAQIVVQDNTSPEVTLSSSFNDSIVYIAEVIQLSWTSSDNVASEHVKIDYRPSNQDWINIVENEKLNTPDFSKEKASQADIDNDNVINSENREETKIS